MMVVVHKWLQLLEGECENRVAITYSTSLDSEAIKFKSSNSGRLQCYQTYKKCLKIVNFAFLNRKCSFMTFQYL